MSQKTRIEARTTKLAGVKTWAEYEARARLILAVRGLKPETKDRLAELMAELGQGPILEAREHLELTPDLPIRAKNIKSVGMPLSAFI